MDGVGLQDFGLIVRVGGKQSVGHLVLLDGKSDGLRKAQYVGAADAHLCGQLLDLIIHLIHREALYCCVNMYI